MTSAKTRMREIAEIEGFEVEILGKDDQPIPRNSQGLPKYNFERRAKSDMTVSEWTAQRFKKVYPEYNVVVLCDDGSPAHGNMKLSKVRETYEEI